MTRIHAKGAVVLVDEHDFSGVVNGVDIDITAPAAEVTAFADAAATFVPGKPGWSVTENGMFSTASPNYDGEMFTDLTSEDRRLGIYPNGVTAGERGYEGQSDIGQRPTPADFGSVIGLNVTWQGDTPLIRSQVLRRGTAESASADGTAYQTGAITAAQTGVGVLRLLAAPGGAGNNTMDVKIQSSADGLAGWSDRITFTQLSQASVALHEVGTVAGAVTDAYWRVVLTYAGAGSRTFSLIVAFGVRPT